MRGKALSKKWYDQNKGHKKDTLKERGFYHSSAWRRVRKVVLQRDSYICQHCKAQGKLTPATEVHHIKELEDFPDVALEVTNLISLCWRCHELTKQRKSKVFPEGVRIIKG